MGTEIANNVGAGNSQTLLWSDSGKLNKCVSVFAAGTKPVVLAAATAADIGKKIIIMQTAAPGGGEGLMTFTTTTQSFDAASRVHLVSNTSTMAAPTFAADGNTIITFTASSSGTNNSFGIGTEITFQVISLTRIRATVITMPGGNASGGTIAFS